mmetsp:Transcript_6622/g.7593  ORF Transcript_6622/g.7593 Transcript_6622/m.7593 type:complete len:99 (+) Transcript_6622:1414-1710(+)
MKRDSKSLNLPNVGRWTPVEHSKFMEVLQTKGCNDWKKIARHVGTRNHTQCRTHAQKYFKKDQAMTKQADNKVSFEDFCLRVYDEEIVEFLEHISKLP